MNRWTNTNSGTIADFGNDDESGDFEEIAPQSLPARFIRPVPDERMAVLRSGESRGVNRFLRSSVNWGVSEIRASLMFFSSLVFLRSFGLEPS